MTLWTSRRTVRLAAVNPLQGLLANESREGVQSAVVRVTTIMGLLAGAYVVYRKQHLVVMVVLAVLSLAFMAAALLRRPRTTIAVATVVIAAIPIYWTPQLPGIPTSTATLVCLPLALIVLFQRGIAKPTALDGVLLLLVFWQVQTFATNFDQPRRTITELIISCIAPYLLMRVLAQDKKVLEVFLSTVVGSALVLSLIALP